MHNNGVSHATAVDDPEGVFKVLETLAYVPHVSDTPVHWGLVLVKHLKSSEKILYITMKSLILSTAWIPTNYVVFPVYFNTGNTMYNLLIYNFK